MCEVKLMYFCVGCCCCCCVCCINLTIMIGIYVCVLAFKRRFGTLLPILPFPPKPFRYRFRITTLTHSYESHLLARSPTLACFVACFCRHLCFILQTHTEREKHKNTHTHKIIRQINKKLAAHNFALRSSSSSSSSHALSER